LAEDGSLVGVVVADGTAYWDPEMRIAMRSRVRVAPVSLRRALATTGKLWASVDERSNVLAIRAEETARGKVVLPRG